MTVHELRRRWKPHKHRLGEDRGDHPTNVRFHRACSWLQRVEETDDGHDIALACQWVAFNALYGQWDDRAREPRPDRACWRAFLDRILALDAGGEIEAVLTEHKKLVMSILDDNYLGNYFWKEPSAKRANQTSKDRRQASMWYVEKRWGLILEHVVDRVYLLRCQLMHGAATHGSKLNRTSLRRCTTMLGHLMPVLLVIWIDHGANEDWGPMCYPPVG